MKYSENAKEEREGKKVKQDERSVMMLNYYNVRIYVLRRTWKLFVTWWGNDWKKKKEGKQNKGLGKVDRVELCGLLGEWPGSEKERASAETGRVLYSSLVCHISKRLSSH
jgi:hypothetical protein